MQPGTHGHNLVVRVLEKKVVVDREDANGVTLKLEECLVGDDTGRMYFTARNGKTFPLPQRKLNPRPFSVLLCATLRKWYVFL